MGIGGDAVGGGGGDGGVKRPSLLWFRTAFLGGIEG